MGHPGRSACWFVAVLLLLVGPALPAGAQDQVAFTIADPRITESSGLASDPDGDRYWTVNDSGDDGVAYGLSREGKVLGTLRFRATPTDAEAIAMYGNRLYIADIGDNTASRPSITVYYFDDPRPSDRTVLYRAYDFAYPDGPHDAETLLVDPTGRLLIVTKEAKGGVYAAPAQLSRQRVNTLARVADAPAFVTDGVFLPAGDRFALRTYVSVEVVDAGSFQTVARGAAPAQPQGESITVSLDGNSLLLGSEGRRSAVYLLPIPITLGNAPSPSASPPATAAPTASASPLPSATPQPGEDDEPEPPAQTADRSGTWLALGLAALTAVLAGLVVALVRRR